MESSSPYPVEVITALLYLETSNGVNLLAK